MNTPADTPADTPALPRERPTLAAIFVCFLRIGSISFGSGMSAWIRRETVLRRPWIDDRTFLSGLALSQIAPGPNGVNMAIFVGTELRGAAGAVAAFAGMMAVPIVFLLVAGAIYAASGALPAGSMFGTALSGMGAAAVGLTLANGVRLTPRNVKGVPGWGVMIVTVLLVGFVRLPLGWVLLGMVPISLLLVWFGPRVPGVRQ